jgi:AraC-like DNA-binding protein
MNSFSHSHSQLNLQRDEVEGIIARFSATHSSHLTAVPGLSVARVTTPVPPTTHAETSCLCLCVRGSRRVSVGDAAFLHGERTFVITGVDVPTIVAIPNASPRNPYTALRIDLDLTVARRIAREAYDHRARPDRARHLVAFKADFGLLDAIARLVRLIDAPRDVGFLADLIHQEILCRLLSGPAGPRFRKILSLASKSGGTAVALEWLRAHFSERVLVGQLAEKAGMGLSTFHRHFQELTSMSPIQYQKQLRLHEARKLMLEQCLDVGSAALMVGYESSTHFIRDFRRTFGITPLRSVASLRKLGMTGRSKAD